MTAAQRVDEDGNSVAEVAGGENLRQLIDLSRRFLNRSSRTGRLRCRPFQSHAGCRRQKQLLVAGFRLCRSGENVNDKLRTLSRLVDVMVP